jgi:hypothetical protein
VVGALDTRQWALLMFGSWQAINLEVCALGFIFFSLYPIVKGEKNVLCGMFTLLGSVHFSLFSSKQMLQ